ncbi:1-acyl-sn-glycerol-3-phosphate acyltransferase [Prevotella nigrescens ATCC 33563]|nr:1-acyl-sn-glycerol-3-phosphate acyltransferase [Prevotella nigrescens ATCC 33563]
MIIERLFFILPQYWIYLFPLVTKVINCSYSNKYFISLFSNVKTEEATVDSLPP